MYVSDIRCRKRSRIRVRGVVRRGYCDRESASELASLQPVVGVGVARRETSNFKIDVRYFVIEHCAVDRDVARTGDVD